MADMKYLKKIRNVFEMHESLYEQPLLYVTLYPD